MRTTSVSWVSLALGFPCQGGSRARSFLVEVEYLAVIIIQDTLQHSHQNLYHHPSQLAESEINPLYSIP